MDIYKILADKKEEIDTTSSRLKYHFLDFPVSQRKEIENSGIDFYKEDLMMEALIVKKFDISFILNYAGVFFLIRFY